MSKKVSVVMAVYNSERYLRQTMESVTAQTLRDIEILCVDDGSTDASADILRSFAEKDDRITVLKHTEKTPGAAAARNMGLDFASGEYLSFLDADDFFESDMLEKAYRKAKEEEADVVLFDGFLFDDSLQTDFEVGWLLSHRNLPEENVFTPAENADHLFRMNPGSAWNVLFDRRMINDNAVRFADAYISDDQVFVYTALTCAQRIAYLDERLVHYRKNNEGSQTSRATEHPEVGYAATVLLRKELERRGILEQYRTALANLSIEVATGYLDQMQTQESFDALFYALKERYLDETCCFDIEEEKFRDPQLVKLRNRIRDLSAEEYLIRQYQNDIFTGTPKMAYPKLLHQIEKGDLIAIYGAGINGRQVFHDFFGMQYASVCAWADQGYKDKGFPVQPPEVLRETAFDKVVIAIEKKEIYQNVKKYLLEMGVEEQKVLWIGKEE